MIEAKVVADSAHDNYRLVTFQLRIHRFMLAEITRHRILSFSVASNRAVPTWKVIDRVIEDPALPLQYGLNQRGMVAENFHTGSDHVLCNKIYLEARDVAVDYANSLVNEMDVHKQTASRLLEPFQWCDLIVTGTEWDNFFWLRLDENAQPEIQEVARKMKEAMESSTPNVLRQGDWHLPYVGDEESLSLEEKKLCSAARVARVSYLNHDKTYPDPEKDIRLAEMLMRDHHWSPFESQATPMKITNGYKTGLWSLKKVLEEPGYSHVDCNLDVWSGNLRGFIQHRKLLDGTTENNREQHAWFRRD